MSDFPDFVEFADPPLRLPINGKTYTIPPVGAELGLQLLDLEENGEKSDSPLAKKKGLALWRELLGSAFDEMLADNVPMAAVSRAGFTVLTEYRFGRPMAESVWKSGLDPEALAASAQAALQKVDSTPSPSTAAANETQRPASTSGTTSPQATRPRKAKAPKAASRGAR